MFILVAGVARFIQTQFKSGIRVPATIIENFGALVLRWGARELKQLMHVED